MALSWFFCSLFAVRYSQHHSGKLEDTFGKLLVTYTTCASARVTVANCYETPFRAFFCSPSSKKWLFHDFFLLSICCTVQPTLLWKVRRHLWQAFGHVHYLCKYRGNGCETAMKLRCRPFFAIVGGKNG
jgi:hypothetical protein